MRRFGIILGLGCSSFAFTAQADAPAPEVDRAAQVIVTDPNYQQQQGYPQQGYPQQGYPQQGGYYQQPGQGVQVVEETTTAEQGRGFEYGGSLFVPVWLADPGKLWNPGIGLDLRAGWELGGGISIDGHLGFTYNALDRNFADTYGYYYDTSLQSVYLGVGLRYAFLNPSALVPFVQAGLQLNLWSFCEGSSCSSEWNTANFGLYGGAGVVFEVNANVGIDLGLNLMGALGSDTAFFSSHDLLLQPFVGLTLYY